MAEGGSGWLVGVTRDLNRADVGCWVVKAHPADVWGYLRHKQASRPLRDGTYRYLWTLHDTYRNGLIRRGDLIAIWVSGEQEPGIHEIGRVTGGVVSGVIDERYLIDVKRQNEVVEAVPFRAVRLPIPYPRYLLMRDPVLAHSELLRVPVMSNPTYLSVAETAALGNRLFARLTDAEVVAAHWDRYVPLLHRA
jgi:hypothetical protein